MKKAIILVGNIGSGKSTIVNRYQQSGYVVISRDMLRYSIGGGNYVFNLEYEPIIWNTELCVLEDFIDLGCNVIIDGTNMSKLMRVRYINILQSYDYYITCMELKKLSKEESVTRRMKNPHGSFNKRTWEKVWEKFDKQYEKPSLDEGFNEIKQL